MARFRNDTGQVLQISDLGRLAGPGEEFDWPGYDQGRHGAVPGCVRLDAPAEPDTAADDPARDGRDEVEPGRRKAARRRPGSSTASAADSGQDTGAPAGTGTDTAGPDAGAENGQEARS
ncbi:MAG: hypothetical protein M0030_26490 [Actinomycetota bacterium]|nr:hypothetical protein [Actinomycetota bacterium]